MDDPIIVTCPWCNQQTSIPDEHQVQTCEVCNATFTLTDAPEYWPDEDDTWLIAHDEQDADARAADDEDTDDE